MLDDLLQVFSGEMQAMAGAIARGRQREIAP